MKHLKLFEEFKKVEPPYRLEQAVPGRELAKGSIGEAVKDIEELQMYELYWFPVASGAGYDVPTLGCLGVTGGDGDDEDSKYDEGNEFTSWSDADNYDSHYGVIHALAKKSGDASNIGEELVYEGLDGLEGLGAGEWISYDEMVKMIATGKVLKFTEDHTFRGHKMKNKFGL